MRDKIELRPNAEVLGDNFGEQGELEQHLLKHYDRENPESMTYAQLVEAVWNDENIPDLHAAGIIMFLGAADQRDQHAMELQQMLRGIRNNIRRVG